MLEFFLSKDTNAIDLMALNRKREQLPFVQENHAVRRKTAKQNPILKKKYLSGNKADDIIDRLCIDCFKTYEMGFEWEQYDTLLKK